MAIAEGAERIFRSLALIVSRGQVRLKSGHHVPLAVVLAGACVAMSKTALSAMVMARMNVRIAMVTGSSICRMTKVMRATL